MREIFFKLSNTILLQSAPSDTGILAMHKVRDLSYQIYSTYMNLNIIRHINRKEPSIFAISIRPVRSLCDRQYYYNAHTS